jgi:hypothetical protein
LLKPLLQRSGLFAWFDALKQLESLRAVIGAYSLMRIRRIHISGTIDAMDLCL